MEEAEVGVVVRQEWVSEARPELWCEGALARLSIRRQAVAGRRRVAVPTLAKALHGVVDAHASKLREEDGSLSVNSLRRDEDRETAMLSDIRSAAAEHGDETRADAVEAAVNRVLATNKQRAFAARDHETPG